MFEIDKIAIEKALNQFKTNEHPLISPLGPALNQPDPAPSLKAWLRNDYNQAKPQDKEQLAPLARCIALELIQPNHYQRVTIAFKELYPRVSNIYGQTNLSEEEFLNGDYYVYMEDANPTIVKMPCAINSMIPKIKKLEDVPAAMAALESTSMQEDKDETGLENLNTHAKRMSARAVVEAYKKEKPQFNDEFIRFIQNLPHRFSRVGFTGEPYSEVNSLLAQIAWACEPGSQESFWKILYPEITGVIDGDSNTQWPRYGEAILSESLAEKKPGSILNYRQLWKKAETARIELIEATKVSGFCPAHRDYWLEVVTRRKNGSANHPERKRVFKTEFSNYYEFFDSMRDFMDAYKATNENGWELDFGDDEEGLQVMLDFRAYQEVILNAPKNLKAIFNSIDQLSSVLQKVVGEKTGEKFTVRIGESCFATNSHTLKNILSRDAVKQILSSIHFGPKSIAPPEKEDALIEGHDALLYLPEHARQLGALSEDSLIDLIKRHEAHGIALSMLVDHYRPILDSSVCKTEKLYNTLYQCDHYDLEAKFIKHIFGGTLNFTPVVNNFRDYLYGLYLLERIQQRVQDASIEEDADLFNRLDQIFEKRLKFFIELQDQFYFFHEKNLDKVIQNIDEYERSAPDLRNLDQIRTKLNQSFPMKSLTTLDLFFSLKAFIFIKSSNEITNHRCIRNYVIETLVNCSKRYSANSELQDKLIALFERVTVPSANFNGLERTKEILCLYKYYPYLPRLRDKILEALTTSFLVDFLCNSLVFNMDALKILSSRNYFTSIESFDFIINSFIRSINKRGLESSFANWLKDHLKSADDFASVVRKTYDTPLLNSLIDKGCVPISTYADFLKIYSELNQEQRERLSRKYPNFSKRPARRSDEDFSKIISSDRVHKLLLAALHFENVRNGIESFFRYFPEELESWIKMPCGNLKIIFDTLCSRYGFEKTMTQFDPLFKRNYKDKPDDILCFLYWSSHQDKLQNYLVEVDFSKAVISAVILNQVMTHYPKHRERIIETTLKNFAHLSEEALDNFKKYFPILTTDEMRLFFDKGLSAEMLLAIIAEPSAIAPEYKNDFKIRLFDVIPDEYLREDSKFLAYIVDPETDPTQLFYIIEHINKSPKLPDRLDLFQTNSSDMHIRDAAALISRDHTRQPLIISSPRKVQKLNQDSDVHQHTAGQKNIISMS